jgi:hypothetical protein
VLPNPELSLRVVEKLRFRIAYQIRHPFDFLALALAFDQFCSAGLDCLFHFHDVVVESVETSTPLLAQFSFEYAQFGKLHVRVLTCRWELLPDVLGRVPV